MNHFQSSEKKGAWLRSIGSTVKSAKPDQVGFSRFAATRFERSAFFYVEGNSQAVLEIFLMLSMMAYPINLIEFVSKGFAGDLEACSPTAILRLERNRPTKKRFRCARSVACVSYARSARPDPCGTRSRLRRPFARHRKD